MALAKKRHVSVRDARNSMALILSITEQANSSVSLATTFQFTSSPPVHAHLQ
jgi:hypothetical protein